MALAATLPAHASLTALQAAPAPPTLAPLPWPAAPSPVSAVAATTVAPIMPCPPLPPVPATPPLPLLLHVLHPTIRCTHPPSRKQGWGAWQLGAYGPPTAAWHMRLQRMHTTPLRTRPLATSTSTPPTPPSHPSCSPRSSRAASVPPQQQQQQPLPRRCPLLRPLRNVMHRPAALLPPPTPPLPLPQRPHCTPLSPPTCPPTPLASANLLCPPSSTPHHTHPPLACFLPVAAAPAPASASIPSLRCSRRLAAATRPPFRTPRIGLTPQLLCRLLVCRQQAVGAVPRQQWQLIPHLQQQQQHKDIKGAAGAVSAQLPCTLVAAAAAAATAAAARV
mmetsp:Transcript_26330/g.71247  ORF Transcript_26330/g.71247 Transcript_26330/m.71247 type:complete len:334 (+) Transcript_26330:302-1303(+)